MNVGPRETVRDCLRPRDCPRADVFVLDCACVRASRVPSAASCRARPVLCEREWRRDCAKARVGELHASGRPHEIQVVE